MSRITSLEVLEVPAPCPVDWDSLAGDERRRFCPRCGFNVHNLSAMPREEAARLVEQRTGRLCVRFARTPAGGVRTLDYSDERPPDLRRRRFLFALTWFGALAAGAASFFGGGNKRRPGTPTSGTMVVGALPYVPPTTTSATPPSGGTSNPCIPSPDSSIQASDG